MANGQFDRLREIQQEVDQRRQEAEQEQAESSSQSFENLQAATEMVAEEVQTVRTGIDSLGGKLGTLIGGQTDLLEVMLDSQTNLEEIQRAVTQEEGESKAARLLQKQHDWEQEKAREEDFQDEYWRDTELDLLRGIHEKLDKPTGDSTGTQPLAAKQEEEESGGGMMMLPGSLSGMLGGAKNLAKLGLKFAGPLALLSGAWSFMEGFSNAESALGRPAEDLGDKIAAGAATVVSDFTKGIGGLANMFLPENMQIPELSPREVIDKAKEAWGNLTSFFTENSIPDIMKSVQDGLGKAARAGASMLADILGGAASMFFGDAVGGIVHDMTSDVLNGLGDMLGSLGDLSYQIMNNLIGDGTAEIQIWDAVTGVWSGIKKAVGGLISGTGDLIWKAFEFFEVDEVPGWIWNKVTSMKDAIVSSITGVFDWYLGGIGRLFGVENLNTEKVAKTASDLTDTIVGGAADIGSWAMGVFDSASESGWDPSSIQDTANDLAEGIKNKVKGWGGQIADFFGFGEDDDLTDEEIKKQKREREKADLQTGKDEQQAFGPGQGQRIARERLREERRERRERQQEKQAKSGDLEATRAQIISQINNRTTVQEVKTVGNPGRRQPATDRVM